MLMNVLQPQEQEEGEEDYDDGGVVWVAKNTCGQQPPDLGGP